ncbi:MAG: thiosulfate oxidation carrier protein SoxY [Gammaproteobacteria bacterium]
MSMKRRTFMKGTMSAAAVGVAAGAGLLAPTQVLAAWNKAAFEDSKTPDAVFGHIGGAPEHSDKITVKAPDIAENGAVVPVTIRADMDGVEEISIIVMENPGPLAASFVMGAGAAADVSCRIKMGKTSDVMGYVKAGGKAYANKKEVKVTIGGCGG